MCCWWVVSYRWPCWILYLWRCYIWVMNWGTWVKNRVFPHAKPFFFFFFFSWINRKWQGFLFICFVGVCLFVLNVFFQYWFRFKTFWSSICLLSDLQQYVLHFSGSFSEQQTRYITPPAASKEHWISGPSMCWVIICTDVWKLELKPKGRWWGLEYG